MQTWSCHTEQVDGCQGSPPCQLVLCSKHHRLKSSSEEGTEMPDTRWVSGTHLVGGTPSTMETYGTTLKRKMTWAKTNIPSNWKSPCKFEIILSSFDVVPYVPYHSAEDALPTFMSTFESFLSTFRVNLHTTFLCENSTSDFAVEKVSADEPQYTERDAEWSEFRLPPKTDEPKSRKSQRQGRSLNHDGSIPFAVRLMSEEAVVDMPVHYLEPQALAPILSLDSKLVSDYPRVGSNLREEDPTQLKKSRYADGIRGLSRSRTMWNQGGLWMHAARLWQAAENKGQKDV